MGLREAVYSIYERRLRTHDAAFMGAQPPRCQPYLSTSNLGASCPHKAAVLGLTLNTNLSKSNCTCAARQRCLRTGCSCRQPANTTDVRK